MSLWTPDGEVPMDDRPGSAASAGEMLGAPGLDDLSPADRARAEEMIAEMAEVRRQILSVPAAQIVGNHLMGFYELAAVHLDQPEPDLAEARLAIDSMIAVLDATESRLGEMGPQLREALTVLQTFYVRRSTDATASTDTSDTAGEA